MQFTVLWADLDPNFHVRHSVYYDWCATARIGLLVSLGFTQERMIALQTGPILFREECIFKKEIRPGDAVQVKTELTRSRRDYSRWSFRHTITVGEKVCALVNVDGAWLDLRIRKLGTLPEELQQAFTSVKTADDFEWAE